MTKPALLTYRLGDTERVEILDPVQARIRNRNRHDGLKWIEVAKSSPTPQIVELSPAMQQYKTFKAKHPGYILFFRMGDFYEMFWEDAVTASKTLGIVLTTRNKIPMAGVPFHAVENYLRKMIAAGHKVAICEQVENSDKKITREITRLMTPEIEKTKTVRNVPTVKTTQPLEKPAEKEESPMARTINAGGTEVGRENTYLIDPEEIVVDRKANARRNGEVDEKRVIQYAKSFLLRGQLQPVVCRKIEDNKIQLAVGYHRQAAAVMIKNGNEKEEIPADPKFRLRVTVLDMNEREAFEASIIENSERNEISVIDQAHNYRRLKAFGHYKNDGALAESIGVNQSWLAVLKNLLRLSDDIQEAIHTKAITLRQGIDLAAMSEEDRKKAIADATQLVEEPVEFPDGFGKEESATIEPAEGRITETAETPSNGDGNEKEEIPVKPKPKKTKIVKKIDKKKLTKSIKEKQESSGQRITLSFSDLKKFLAAEYEASPTVTKIKAAILAYAKGEKGPKATNRAIAALVDGTAVSEEPTDAERLMVAEATAG